MARQKPKQIAANAFYMASPAQSWAGLWAHPQSNGPDYNTIGFWTDLAELAERGLIDAVFLADILGANDVYGGSADVSLRAGTMSPSLDPFVLVSAMAAVTENLCFGITGNTTYEEPYLLARRLSSLDHLTRGRMAWNVVTGVLASTGRAIGMSEQVAHDKRYDMADEYMELIYKLLEGSWEDSAVLRDRTARMFADGAKVHKVSHKGEFYRCEGIHLVEPSPQRTPLIYAAGASLRGRRFAGSHAEATFMASSDIAFTKRAVEGYRAEAVKAGRRPDSVRVFNAATIVVAPTEAQAREKERELQKYSDEEGNLAMFSQWLGIDLSKYDPDEPIRYIETNAIQSIVDQLTKDRGDREWRVRDLGAFGKIGGREAYFAGSTEQVCDELMHWTQETGLDGFNLTRTVEPDGLESFVDLVVPELQNRGAYKTEYRPGTMREKFFPGKGPHLAAEHPGYAHRRGRPAAGPEGV
jgi:FMN-dependent oxidoreductase (nitrilotriacetate monooxygenase family)